MKKTFQSVVLSFCLLNSALISAQDLSNPSPGDILQVSLTPPARKSQVQMNRDEGECYALAKKETGVDPLSPPPRPESPQEQRGPLATAAPIAVGVAMHSPIGLGVTAARRRRDANQNNQQQTSYDDAWQQSINSVRHSFKACMTNRGYSVD